MKFLYFIIVWTVSNDYLNFVNSFNFDFFQQPISTLPPIVEERCALNSNNSFDVLDLEDALLGLPECIKEGVEGNIMDLIVLQDVEGTCQYIKKLNIIPCIAHFITKLKPCLYGEEKSTVEFYFIPFVLTLDVMCSAEGKEILENILSASGQCHETTPAAVEVNQSCYEQTNLVKWFVDKYYVLTKEDYCSDVEITYKCLIEFFLLDCQKPVREFIAMMYAPKIDACHRLIN